MANRSVVSVLVGFEHIANSGVGVPVEPYTLRDSHIFRREDGEWKIAHRHADYVLIDQTATAVAMSHAMVRRPLRCNEGTQ